MSVEKYNIIMFAYNEADNIESAIRSVKKNVDGRLNKFHIIANGCTDNTVEQVNMIKEELDFDKLVVTDLSYGDKCNAWNYYAYKIADRVGVHFFVDADVSFSEQCFPKMYDHLMGSSDSVVTIAGLPLSGRNLSFYRSLVVERACFFGNLYGLKGRFLERVREESFYLPVGLNWIDSFLTKAVNTDLNFFDYNLPDRTTYMDGVGYAFQSLSPFSRRNVKLYFSRIARYELGKIQEVHLDNLPVKKWPRSLDALNAEIWKNFPEKTSRLSLIRKILVKNRLKSLTSRKYNNCWQEWS